MSEPCEGVPQTVKVRIAVAVSSDGSWAAHGWGSDRGLGESAEQLQSSVVEMLETDLACASYWLEAEVPVPGGAIKGLIVEGGK